MTKESLESLLVTKIENPANVTRTETDRLELLRLLLRDRTIVKSELLVKLDLSESKHLNFVLSVLDDCGQKTVRITAVRESGAEVSP